MITKEELTELYEYFVCTSLGTIGSYCFDHNEYKKAKETFIFILKYYIQNHKLTLAYTNQESLHNDSIINANDIDNQILLLEQSIPSECIMKEMKGYWWYLDECPVSTVWIVDNEINSLTTPAGDGKYYYWG